MDDRLCFERRGSFSRPYFELLAAEAAPTPIVEKARSRAERDRPRRLLSAVQFE
jgi:hypothetical protein